jgi:hypothetical protein
MKMPVLGGSLSEALLKKPAQVSRGAKAGAPANLFEAEIGLLQQGTNPGEAAANDFIQDADSKSLFENQKPINTAKSPG